MLGFPENAKIGAIAASRLVECFWSDHVGHCVCYRYVSEMYLSEALVALDRIADAVELLNPDAVTDVTTTVPETKQEAGQLAT